MNEYEQLKLEIAELEREVQIQQGNRFGDMK
jgi:hypothetical protein